MSYEDLTSLKGESNNIWNISNSQIHCIKVKAYSSSTWHNFPYFYLCVWAYFRL